MKVDIRRLSVGSIVSALLVAAAVLVGARGNTELALIIVLAGLTFAVLSLRE